MRVVYDRVEAMVLPESAFCILAQERLCDMTECQAWKCDDIGECDPDCEYYTEENDPEEGT